MSGALLEARGLTRRFGTAVALAAFDLAIMPGEFFALLGGSGSGKSTLLRLIAGLDTPDGGRLLLDGRDITETPPWARPVNMMFQSYALFPHLSVAANIAYGLKRAGIAREERARRVAEALALVRMEGFDMRRPHQLSGGQRQRVALARSLVMRPRLLLLDEPLAALDAGLREQTGFELRALQRATGAAFVMVTHDQGEALALADRVAVLEAGRLVQLGTPAEVYGRPVNAFVARFLGGANVLARRSVRGEGTGAPGPFFVEEGPGLGGVLPPVATEPGTLMLAPAEPGAAAYALRPERIRLYRDSGEAGTNRGRGTVREVSFRGESSLLVVTLEDGAALRVTVPTEAMSPRVGEAVSLAWAADDLTPLEG